MEGGLSHWYNRTMRRDALLDRVTAHYRALLDERLVGLVLYGSRARGQARDSSDLDLFLLAEGLPGDPFDRNAALPFPPIDPRTEPPISVRALTPAEYARDIAPLDLDIALDGLVLYDRDGTITEQLARIRRRIAEAGLYRNGDLCWHWKTEPTRRDWAVTWEGVRL